MLSFSCINALSVCALSSSKQVEQEERPGALVEKKIENSYPRLINSSKDRLLWKPVIDGIQTTTEALILGELIRSGVIKGPEDVEKYQSVWKTAFDPGQAVISLPKNEEKLSSEEQALLSKLQNRLSVGFSSAEDEISFLSSISSRRVLERLSKGEQAARLSGLIQKHWDKLNLCLKEIIYKKDKEDYKELLSVNLQKQKDCTNFYAPIMLIDLNNMERFVLPAKLVVVDKDRVLILVDKDGKTIAGAINPKDQSTVKMFFRKVFPQDNQYLLYYFPKMTYGQSGWCVGTDYQKQDHYFENLLGKNDYKNNLMPAIDNFMTAFEKENTMQQSSSAQFKKLISPELLEKIRSEPTIEFRDILDLMLIMSRSTCRAKTIDVFKLTTEQYYFYENKVFELLKNNKGLSREEFLVKAIEVCDGRASLAAVVSYNVLLHFGEIGQNSLFIAYPESFKMLDNIQDQAGSIYHFMGCFFAAYSVQRWLVERYHKDDKFAVKMNEYSNSLRGKVIADKLKNPNMKISNLNALHLLLAAQVRLLGVGSEKNKEILSAAGVFFEEVVEDRESTLETQEDIKGIAAGHAFYELVSNKSLKQDSVFRKDFFDSISKVLNGEIGLSQILLALFTLLPQVSE